MTTSPSEPSKMTVLKKLRGDSAPTCTPSATFVNFATHLSMSPTTSGNEDDSRTLADSEDKLIHQMRTQHLT
jgi:hypothetical protein